MSSFEINKIVGAILLVALVGTIINMLGNALVQPRDATPIQIAAEPVQPAAPQQPTVEPVLPLLAQASVEAGQQVARRCVACHTFEEGGASRVGPNLYDIVNADKAHIDGFNYSQAMRQAEGTWTYESLNQFLANPRAYIPGNRMAFAGLPSVKDRADLIAYLRSLSPNPAPLPTPEEIEAVKQQAAGAEAKEAQQQPAEPAEPAAPEAPAPPQQQGAAVQPAAGIEPIAPLLAKANPDAGKQAARKCTACHTFEKGGPNRVGPNLWGIVNADKAHLDNFNYSPALRKAEGTWTYESLNAYLAKPSAYVPGTRMAFAGIPRAQERADLIAYLRTLHDSPPPLP